MTAGGAVAMMSLYKITLAHVYNSSVSAVVAWIRDVMIPSSEIF